MTANDLTLFRAAWQRMIDNPRHTDSKLPVKLLPLT